MKGKMFGHRLKKTAPVYHSPGSPQNQGDMDHSMDNGYGRSKGGPPGYEGKEHVRYKDPGYTRHEIRYPEDEPHMKSHVSKEEMHEAEDDYHMDVPDQTYHTLEKNIKRARMKMDAPNQEDPKPILGNPVHNVLYLDRDWETSMW